MPIPYWKVYRQMCFFSITIASRTITAALLSLTLNVRAELSVVIVKRSWILSQ